MKNAHSLIVGGTRGIGFALVRMFAAQHHRVSVIGRRIPLGKDKRIRNVHYWATDLRDRRGLLKTAAQIIRKNGKVHNLVFFQRYRGEGNDWKGEIETSLTATKELVEYAVDQFDEASDHSIVIVSSLASHLVAYEQPVSYHVAKAALSQMVRYYAVTLAPRAIRVNGVEPGSVLKEEAKDFYLRNRRLVERHKEVIPLRRMGVPDDIAHAIGFLCSTQASYITGQNIVVDGGLSLMLQTSLAHRLVPVEVVP